MVISAIVAKSTNNVIGINNSMAWHLPNDLKYFKNVTLGHTVLMGRNTFESIGKPLQNRTTLVLTSNKTPISGVTTVNSLGKAIEIAKRNGETELFIIGGGQVYELAMPILNKIYVTEVHAEIKGNVYFPYINDKYWQEVSRKRHFKDEKHAFDYDFVVYEGTF